MEPELSTGKSVRVEKHAFGERFTQRLEAFSDLVFGFSLSLLATRLEIPASPAEVFDATRWGTFVITFGMICAIWLAHYRIFRRRFIAETPDVIVNFVFLLGIAVLPYAVQTLLRLPSAREANILYFGDFAFIFAALATLRWRALRQRRGDEEPELRLREWRGTVRQYVIVLTIVAVLVAMNAGLMAPQKFFTVVPVTFVVISLASRVAVRRLPKFLE
jgi:uncharacterized membrane protein